MEKQLKRKAKNSKKEEVEWHTVKFSDLMEAEPPYPIFEELSIPKKPQDSTPPLSTSYIFDLQHVCAALLAWKLGEPMWIVGPSGCGKTEFSRQMAALLNLGFYRLNFERRITRGMAFGQDRIMAVNGTPVQKFIKGIITQAIQEPSVLLLDEWDHADNQTRMAMQPVLEGDDLRLLELGVKRIKRHKKCLIIATSNTWGTGDESGLYGHGVEMINFSTINRFTVKIQMDYPSEDEEILALHDFHTGITSDQRRAIKNITKITSLVRDGFKNGTVTFPVTTRDVFAWVAKYLLIDDIYKTAELTFLSAFPERDKGPILEIIQRVSGEDVNPGIPSSPGVQRLVTTSL